MIILGIETSCDETSVGIIRKNKDSSLTLLSSITSSSLSLHAKTGGIIPEIAAREQVKYILPTLKASLKEGLQANLDNTPPIDIIAVTYGPGLIGSLLVGIETARTLGMLWEKPVIPVNHMLGHIYANFLNNPEIKFPALALVVSGGHTDLVFLRKHGDYKVLGGTRDDAAGEAFDKIARILGLAYPGGPEIEKRAKAGDNKRFSFPRPLYASGDFDFSFSGLKTAVYREVSKYPKLSEQLINDFCAGTLAAITDILVRKTMQAALKHEVKAILLAGGVAANKNLASCLKQAINEKNNDLKLFIPPISLCTDNGAMIAAAAAYIGKKVPPEDIAASPQLYY